MQRDLVTRQHRDQKRLRCFLKAAHPAVITCAADAPYSAAVWITGTILNPIDDLISRSRRQYVGRSYQVTSLGPRDIDSIPENRRQKEFNSRYAKVMAARRSTIC